MDIKKSIVFLYTSNKKLHNGIFEDVLALTHRYREQTRGYQWWEGKGEGHFKSEGGRGYSGIRWNRVWNFSKL